MKKLVRKTDGMEQENDPIKIAQDIDIMDNVMIHTVSSQVGFKTLMDGVDKKHCVVPNFQRAYRWSEQQVEELAISLFRGMPIPPIYAYRNEEQQVVILDGQQRIISLYLYYIGKYIKKKKNGYIDMRKLTDSMTSPREYLEDYGLVDKVYKMRYKDSETEEEKVIEITYKNLSERIRRRIDFSAITLFEVSIDSKKYKEETLHKIFANLNIGGTPLSAQELRNGIYSCKFYNMLREINQNSKKWRKIYSGRNTSEIDKESKDVELLLKLCAFEYYVQKTKNGFQLSNYKGKISTLLDDFSKEAMSFTKDEIDWCKVSLIHFFEGIEAIPPSNKSLLLISLYVVISNTGMDIKLSEEICNEIVYNSDYKDTVKQGTSAKAQIEKRLEIVYDILSKYDN